MLFCIKCFLRSSPCTGSATGNQEPTRCFPQSKYFAPYPGARQSAWTDAINCGSKKQKSGTNDGPWLDKDRLRTRQLTEKIEKPSCVSSRHNRGSVSLKLPPLFCCFQPHVLSSIGRPNCYKFEQ